LTPEDELTTDQAIKRADDPTTNRELRNSTRRALSCPVTLRLSGKKYCGETIDISANGVLLRTQCPVTTGASVHYTIALPGDVFGMATSIQLNCQGRVVRCSPAKDQEGQDVAIVIDDYNFEPVQRIPARKTA
jgi:hypothetical protein